MSLTLTTPPQLSTDVPAMDQNGSVLNLTLHKSENVNHTNQDCADKTEPNCEQNLNYISPPSSEGSTTSTVQNGDHSTEYESNKLLYTTDLSRLSTQALKKTLKSLKLQTRHLRVPIPTLQEKIEDIEFACFASEKDFENYSKFEVKNVVERLLEQKALEDKVNYEPRAFTSNGHLDMDHFPKVNNNNRGRESATATSLAKRQPATVPYQEQFHYDMDFLDDEQVDSSFEAMDLSTSTPTTTSTERQPRTSAFSVRRKNNNIKNEPKVNITFINGQTKTTFTSNSTSTSSVITEVGTKRPRTETSLPNKRQTVSPNKRMNLSVSSNHVYSPQPVQPTTSAAVNYQSTVFRHDDVDDKSSIKNVNDVRRFTTMVPEMLSDVAVEDRETLFNQCVKILAKKYSACVAQAPLYRARKETLAKKVIKCDQILKEIRRQLQPPPPLPPPRPLSLILQPQPKSNASQIVILPHSNRLATANTTKVVNTPTSSAGNRAQIVNRKLVFTSQQKVIKPVSCTTIRSDTPPTSQQQAGVATMNRGTSSTSTGTPTYTTLINPANIKLAPSSNVKQLIVRQVNPNGNANMPAQPQKILYILKPVNGQPATLVPFNAATTSFIRPIGASNGQQPQQSRIVHLTKPISLAGKTFTTTTTATASPSSPIITNGTVSTGNCSFIRLNNTNGANSNLKLVLNPSLTNSSTAPTQATLNNSTIKSKQFLFGQLPSTAHQRQHIVINNDGSNNKMATSVGVGQIVATKPSVSVTATSVAQ